MSHVGELGDIRKCFWNLKRWGAWSHKQTLKVRYYVVQHVVALRRGISWCSVDGGTEEEEACATGQELFAESKVRGPVWEEPELWGELHFDSLFRGLFEQ